MIESWREVVAVRALGWVMVVVVVGLVASWVMGVFLMAESSMVAVVLIV